MISTYIYTIHITHSNIVQDKQKPITIKPEQSQRTRIISYKEMMIKSFKFFLMLLKLI